MIMEEEEESLYVLPENTQKHNVSIIGLMRLRKCEYSRKRVKS